jgi:phosphosulfolactate phosphohydrolase-like enzyme
MPSIVSASSLRSVLGVSSSLYSDAYLDDIIDTSEGVILPLLTAHSVAVTHVEIETNIAYFTTQMAHQFVEGQSIILAGIIPATFNGTRTVTDDHESELMFTTALVNADITLRATIPAGTATLSGQAAAVIYIGNSNVESAVLNVSVEVFQSRVAPGGQIEGVDFNPSPFRMGRSLYNRISGLLGNQVDVNSVIG